jgi:cytochrome c556
MRHKKNLKYRFNNGKRSGPAKTEPRVWSEFRTCGEQLVRLQAEIVAIKAAERAARDRAKLRRAI